MFRVVFIAFLTLSQIACTSTPINRKTEDTAPVIARAIFSNTLCPNDPQKGQAESALTAAATSWLIGKAAESAVNYISSSIAEAAKQDRETFTITGQNPDYLFRVQGDKTLMRGCLYVIVAPRVKDGKWCDADKGGNWYDKDSCRTPAPEVEEKWQEWSLGNPKFYAEIGMTSPVGGPATTVIPQAYKVYYPQPISTMSKDKIKGITIGVTASKPTKSTAAAGDIVLEIFLGGDGVTPSTVSSDATALQTSGLWVNVPTADGLVGENFAGPVNLTVTVAETPHPTKWLQALAKYSDENKQKAIDTLVTKYDPKAKKEVAEAEIIDSLALEGAAATACAAFSKQMATLASAQEDVKNGKGATAEERLQYGYTLDATCATTKLLKRTTQVSWEAAGKSASVPLCGRAQSADSEISILCQR